MVVGRDSLSPSVQKVVAAGQAFLKYINKKAPEHRVFFLC
jgi:hypothetical protein